MKKQFYQYLDKTYQSCKMKKQKEKKKKEKEQRKRVKKKINNHVKREKVNNPKNRKSRVRYSFLKYFTLYFNFDYKKSKVQTINEKF